MKTEITVSTNGFTQVPWPNEQHVPVIGDMIVMRHNNQTLAFKVTERVFSVGLDPRDNTETTQIIIKGV